MEALARGLGGHDAALAGGLDSLLEDAAGGGVNLNFRFGGDEWIDALRFAHTLNVDHLTAGRKWKMRAK